MTPPVSIVCVGMAGSGKTTFMQRINSHLHANKQPPYVLNLDPAVMNLPFDSNIDIRDSINYKEVMKQYNLGPNGGILTSLNLFATKVDQILSILERRCGMKPNQQASSSTNAGTASQMPSEDTQPAQPEQSSDPIKHIIVDTPGQIEVFVWSASGQILLSSLASSFPTVLAYIVDTPRTASTSTFMSNMLYACSILYKTRLPMIVVFNKTDVKSASFAKEWMTDFEAFQMALKREEDAGSFGGDGSAFGGSGYMGSLLNSMSLVFEEFYKHLNVVGVSSYTGQGMDEFFKAVEQKAEEFERDYKPELNRRQEQRRKEKEGKRNQDLDRLMRDMNMGGGIVNDQQTRQQAREESGTISDLEDEMGEQPDAEILDPDGGDEEDDGDEDNQGLPGRYRQALNQDQSQPAQDMSFSRYIQASNINR